MYFHHCLLSNAHLFLILVENKVYIQLFSFSFFKFNIEIAKSWGKHMNDQEIN